jgi:hypothetical protein
MIGTGNTALSFNSFRHSQGETGATATASAESQCLRGAVGVICQGGVPLTAHPVW